MRFPIRGILLARRDRAAALGFFDKAMKPNGVPEQVTSDKSGISRAAVGEINGLDETQIIVKQANHQTDAQLQVIWSEKKKLCWHLFLLQTRSSTGNATGPRNGPEA